MIDEENKSATMPETPTAPAVAPAHAAPTRPATVEPEDTVFSLPLSHVTQEYPALVDDEDADTEQLDAPIGAHAAEQPAEPEATPAPAHFAEPVAEAINESATVFAAPEPAAPVFPVAPASEAAPASATPAEVEQPVAAPAAAPESSAQPQSTPAPSHFATPEPTAAEPQQDGDPADRVTEDLNLPDVSDVESGRRCRHRLPRRHRRDRCRGRGGKAQRSRLDHEL